ncbi:PAS domain-containing protein [Spirosoma flavum]|uniref:PAS domain-containing protein n=1 Tax=Spirosoma flavum TaxID=2048557 RepID=A0ABW6AK98_9BACT
MNFSGPYDKQIAAQYRGGLLTPLLAGWEFRQKPALLAGQAGWLSLAKNQDWILTAPIRHDLMSDKWVIVVTDSDQVIQYVNPRFEEMTGYTHQEVIGRRPTFLQGERTSLLSRQRIKQAIQQRRSVSERLLNYRKDQTPYWCQIVIRPIVNRQKQVVNFIAFEQEVPSDESYVDR